MRGLHVASRKYEFSDRQSWRSGKGPATRLDSGRNNSIIFFVLISALVADTVLSNISDITGDQGNSAVALVSFIVIVAAVFGAGQLLMLGYIKQTSSELRDKKHELGSIYKAIMVTQYVLMGILALMTMQMALASQYYVGMLVAATTIGYMLGGIMMGLLTYRFFSWYRTNKQNLQVFLYGLGSALTSGSLIAGIVSQDALLLENNILLVGPQSAVEFPTIDPDSMGVMGAVLGFGYLLAIVAYLFVWAASVLLLRHYSKKIGRIKYWSVVSLPLISFIFGLAPIMLSLPVTSTYFDPSLLAFRILSIAALIANGVLFGLAFFSVAKSMRHQVRSTVIDYLNISAYGVALLYVSIAANIAHGSYPPFGVAAYSFIGVAAYFFMLGLYSSAVSVSTDIKLRRLIRKSVLDEFRLIDSISTANLEQETYNRMVQTVKKHSDNIKEAEVPSSFAEEDMQRYLDMVLKEIKDTRPDDTKSDSEQ
jgi:MFS family permease